MDAEPINSAIIAAIGKSAVPRVDRQKLVGLVGESGGRDVAELLEEIAPEAVATPSNWRDLTSSQGIEDIMADSARGISEASSEALEEISRCVGGNLW